MPHSTNQHQHTPMEDLNDWMKDTSTPEENIDDMHNLLTGSRRQQHPFDCRCPACYRIVQRVVLGMALAVGLLVYIILQYVHAPKPH